MTAGESVCRSPAAAMRSLPEVQDGPLVRPDRTPRQTQPPRPCRGAADAPSIPAAIIRRGNLRRAGLLVGFMASWTLAHRDGTGRDRRAGWLARIAPGTNRRAVVDGGRQQQLAADECRTSRPRGLPRPSRSVKPRRFQTSGERSDAGTGRWASSLALALCGGLRRGPPVLASGQAGICKCRSGEPFAQAYGLHARVGRRVLLVGAGPQGAPA